MNRERLIESFAWGERSLAILATCDDRLQRIAEKVIQCTPIDISIISGWRNEQEQDDLVRRGLSKTLWPNSKHNHRASSERVRHRDGGATYAVKPWSQALDFAPYVNGGIDWKDERAFALAAGVWMSCAKALGYRLRWGGDWDGDGSTMDQSFMDIGHLELVA